jgi:hypothetical protein
MHKEASVKYVLLTVLLMLVISPSVYSREQLIVTRAGKAEATYDVTNYQPGEFYFYLDQDYYTRYLWQGEDSINYYIEDGLLWVNGEIVGIDFEETSLDDVSTREGILTAIAEGPDIIYLYQLPDLKAVQVPHVNGNVDFSLLNEMTNLVALDLADGAQSDSSLVYLKPLKNLKLLYLGWGVTDTGLAHIEELTNLKCLYLAHARITDDGLTHLTLLINLEELTLGTLRPATEAHITDKGLLQLVRLTNLRELYLSCSFITDTGLVHLASLHKLEDLSLFATDISDTGLAYLTGLAELRYLNLCGTRVGDGAILYLARLPQLRWLNLAFTNLTDEGLNELGKLPNLRTLVVGGYDVPVTDSAFREFQSTYPQCEIHWLDFWPD